MTLLKDNVMAFIGYLQNFTWYYPFYWLLGAYFLVYIWAWALSSALPAIQKGKQPVEKSVHLAWGTGFLVHFVAFLIWGSDYILHSWYMGAVHVAVFGTGIAILLACCRVLPYVLMVAFDLWLAFKLIRAGMGSGGGSRRKAARA